MAAPLIAYVLSKPVASLRPQITDDDRDYLRMVAEKTWRYFDTFVNEDNRFLPPDNVQFDPEPRVATRHLADQHRHELVGYLSAHDLGFIDTESLLTRLERTITTVDGLEHFEGHLLNWYDTHTLEPLLPKYVSTVDSATSRRLADAGGGAARAAAKAECAPEHAARLTAWPRAPQRISMG